MSTTELAVSIDDILLAAERIAGAVRRTPLIPLEGPGWLVKAESLQITGSFKVRGAMNAVRALRPDAVVTASSGNHGAALAHAARAAGIPCTVVMTPGASAFKRARTVALGAKVVDVDANQDVRNRRAAELAERHGSTYIPPYDHPLTIAGQGSAGLEIVEDALAASDQPRFEAVVVPVGGGGLLSGVATAVRALHPSARIIGVEPDASNDFCLSRARRERVTVPNATATICDGARADTPGDLTWPIVDALVDDLVAVSDAEVISALDVLARGGVYVEPTGALAAAGALALGLGHGTVVVASGRNWEPREVGRLLVDHAASRGGQCE